MQLNELIIFGDLILCLLAQLATECFITGAGGEQKDYFY